MFNNINMNGQGAMPQAANALNPTPGQLTPSPLLAKPPLGSPMPMPHMGVTPDHPILQAAQGGSRPADGLSAMLSGKGMQSDNAVNQEGSAASALNPNENQGPDWGE